MSYFKVLILLFILSSASSVSAKLIQIIHTNDLHSYFNGTRNGFGGYARLKTLISELKSEAESKGIRTLFLDAGDFGEGSSYYFAERGVASMRALDLLGVDVTILGNHDFILGGKELRRQLVASELKSHILSANLKNKPLFGLQKRLPDYVDYDIDGLKLRIFGLTTNEIHYQYPLRPLGYIKSSHKSGIKMAEKAQRHGVDFLIGLTHIGLEKDIQLVTHSRTIDLIVGGHSHTRLEKPQMVKNLRGELIPIVQTGAHGMAVGSMILDLHGKGDYALVDYKLYDVTQDIPEDASLQKFVKASEVNREQYFNRKWDEVIGFSEITLTGLYNGHIRDGKSCWSHHLARLARETAKTDIGIQFDIFQGEEIPAGVLRFGDLIDNFPHFTHWGDHGWNISRARVSGFILKKLIQLVSQGSQPIDMTLDGVEVFVAGRGLVPFKIGSGYGPEDARVHGEQIQNSKFYTIGLPTEVPRAVGKLFKPLRNLVFGDLVEVENSDYWPLLESYIKKNSPIRCL